MANSNSRIAPAGPVTLADAFRQGLVELAVTVVPGAGDGKSLRVTFRNTVDAGFTLAISAGPTMLDVGTPVDKLRLHAAKAKMLYLPPLATSRAVDLAQTGTRRAVQGAFVVSVHEGTPRLSGDVTMR